MKCFECGGEVVEVKSSIVLYRPDGSPVFFEDVPVGACKQCGEKYLSGSVSEKISGVLESGRIETSESVSVPVVHI